jgi:hypothetical protein
LCLALPGFAAARPLAYCASDYAFDVQGPAGWQRHWTPSGESVQIVFEPSGGPSDARISVALLLAGSSGAEGDPKDLLSISITFSSAFGRDVGVREFEATHPAMRTAAAWLVFPHDESRVVALIPPHAGGRHFVVALATSGRTATPEEIEVLRATVRSLRFDPDHGCEPDPQGKVVETRVERDRRVAEKPAVEEAEDEEAQAARAQAADTASRGYSLGRALAGCSLIEQLFVPVGCQEVELERERVVLIKYYGDEKWYAGDRPEPTSKFVREHRTKSLGAPFFARKRDL